MSMIAGNALKASPMGIGQMSIIDINIQTQSLVGRNLIMHVVWIKQYKPETNQLIIQPFNLDVNESNKALISNILDMINGGIIAVIHTLKSNINYELAISPLIKEKLDKSMNGASDALPNIYCKNGDQLEKISSITKIVTYNEEQNKSIRGVVREWCEVMVPKFSK